MSEGEPTRSSTPESEPKEPAQAAPPRELPRWSLTIAAGLHGLVFGWAGSMLPWSDFSTFSILCWLLSLGHFATAVLAAGKLRPLTWTWRVSSVFGLCVFGWLAWEISSSASYLAGLYGDLGQGVGALLFAVVGLVGVFIVPMALWGLASTWDPRWNRSSVVAGGVLAVIWIGGSVRTVNAARAQPLPQPSGNTYDVVRQNLPAWEELKPVDLEPPETARGAVPAGEKLRLPSLFTREPIACVPEIEDDQATAVLTYLVPASPETIERRNRSLHGRRLAAVEPVTRCVRAPAEALGGAIADQLRAEASRGPVKIDVLTGVAMMRSRNFVLDMFALRPGRDGICDADRCLMPWQLTAMHEFSVNEPLGWIPDFRFGVSPVRLQRALGGPISADIQTWDRHLRRPKTRKQEDRDTPLVAPEGAEGWSSFDGLLRIETLSMAVTTQGRAMELARLHEIHIELSQARLDKAREWAEAHIAAQQLPEGRFTYTLDPFTGGRRTKAWNLPRQAGTTLVLCERGKDEERTKAVADRSLSYMAQHARRSGDAIALIRNRRSNEAQLGSTALPAISFLACRDRVGDHHDPLIAGMAALLIAMQRDDGSFYPQYDVEAGAPIDGPEPMYAGGQALFALSLAEKMAREHPEAAAAAGLPSAEALGAAFEAGAAYYAGPYWDNFLRDFFFLEENWHCLAARASLGHHRIEAYEQFCLDYMAYKARVPMDEDSRVDDEFLGGYSMSNVLTPVNTPVAGYGEGLAAAMAIKQARGEDISADRQQMLDVIDFLVRQQWTPETCWGCATNRVVVGGFSESMSAPEIRIDYTQHAWAALGHGGDFVREMLPETVGADDALLPEASR